MEKLAKRLMLVAGMVVVGSGYGMKKETKEKKTDLVFSLIESVQEGDSDSIEMLREAIERRKEIKEVQGGLMGRLLGGKIDSETYYAALAGLNIKKKDKTQEAYNKLKFALDSKEPAWVTRALELMEEGFRGFFISNAIRQGRLDIMKKVVEEWGVDLKTVDLGGKTNAWHQAAYHGEKEIIEYLVEKKVGEIDGKGKFFTLERATPLFLAMVGEDMDKKGKKKKQAAFGEIKKMLQDNGAKQEGVLLAAAANNQHEMIDQIRDEVQDVNAVTKDGYTALQLAAMKGHIVSVGLLLKEPEKKMPEVDKKGPGGRTAAHLAAMEGHKGVLDVLVKNGAKMKVADEANMTPLELAVEKGAGKKYAEVIGFLVKNEVGVGEEWLEYAAKKGRPKIVAALLENVEWDTDALKKAMAQAEREKKVAKKKVKFLAWFLDENKKRANESSKRVVGNYKEIIKILKKKIKKSGKIEKKTSKPKKQTPVLGELKKKVKRRQRKPFGGLSEWSEEEVVYPEPDESEENVETEEYDDDGSDIEWEEEEIATERPVEIKAI